MYEQETPQLRQILNAIHDNSEKLMQEFMTHVREVREQSPECTDMRKIFEGWAIQKISGLQMLVVQLTERVASIEAGI